VTGGGGAANGRFHTGRATVRVVIASPPASGPPEGISTTRKGRIAIDPHAAFYITGPFAPDPVKSRVALLAADPPDNAKASNQFTYRMPSDLDALLLRTFSCSI